MNSASYYYVHDSSCNLLASTRHGSQGGHPSPHMSSRLFPNPCNNQAVPAAFTGNDFDRAGNMLQTPTLPRLSWDVTNMMQTTTQAANALGQANREFYIYTASLSRTRKVSETTNRSGSVIQITVSLYFGMVEKRSTYKGVDLSYDGVGVYDQGQRTAPEKTETDLRIMDMTGAGHRQVARQRTTVAHKERETTVEFCASNHIDSDQLRLSVSGEIVSYQNYRPFGAVAYQYGATRSNHYGYSGQETDVTGLSYYGSRYYCPELRRWLSCDKAGDPDHTLNRYAFVRGNPITFRDVRGFMTETEYRIIAGVILALILITCGIGCGLAYINCILFRIWRPVPGTWHEYRKTPGSGCASCKISETKTWFYHGHDEEGQRIERMIRTTGKEALKSLIDELNKKTFAPGLDKMLKTGFGTQYAKVLDGIKNNFNKIYNAFFNDALDLRPYGSHITSLENTAHTAAGATVGNISRLGRGVWYDTKADRPARPEEIVGPNKTPSQIEFRRYTDDFLFFVAVHEIAHNETGVGINDHQYKFSQLSWWDITKDRNNNVVGLTEKVGIEDLDPQKTLENPDSYGFVALAWKRSKMGKCLAPALRSGEVAYDWRGRIQSESQSNINAPIKSTLTKPQVVMVSEDMDTGSKYEKIEVVYRKG